MNRNATAVLLATAALVGLALGACGGSGTVKVGVVVPESGQWEVYGDPIKKGIELAYDESKQKPGKHAIELVFLDSESRPQKAAEQLEVAYEGGCLTAIGGVTTDEALAMVPVMDEKDRVLLSPSASSPKLTGISSNFFRIFPSDFREGAKMGNFAAQILGLNRAVIIAAESPYAMGIQDVFKTEFERYGGEVAAVIEYPVGHTEFADDVKKALAYDPEAVYVADYAFEIGSIVKQLRSQGFNGRILTTHAFAAPGVFADVGSAVEGVLLTRTIFDVGSTEPAVKTFVDAYRAKYIDPEGEPEDPDSFAAHGYDSFKVIEQALDKGGTLPHEFWKGMRQIKLTGASGVIQFDEKGDVSQFPRVYGIENGVLIDYEHVVEERKKEILRRLDELKRQQAEAARRAASGRN